MNKILGEVPDQVGYIYIYDMLDHNINALAFADDLVLIAATREGAQRSLDRVVAALLEFGLELAPAKCAAFSLVPSGKTKKMKVLSDSQFTAGGCAVPQLGVLQAVRYIEVLFTEIGPAVRKVELLSLLDRITRALLKPQQRLKILKTYLIPRFIHSLVLGRASYGLLRKLDRQVRAVVRRWLRLPDNIPIYKAFFHSSIAQGGLGISSYETSVPRVTLARFERLSTSQYEAANVVGASAWAVKRRRWCGLSRRRDGSCLLLVC